MPQFFANLDRSQERKRTEILRVVFDNSEHFLPCRMGVSKPRMK